MTARALAILLFLTLCPAPSFAQSQCEWMLPQARLAFAAARGRWRGCKLVAEQKHGYTLSNLTGENTCIGIDPIWLDCREAAVAACEAKARLEELEQTCRERDDGLEAAENLATELNDRREYDGTGGISQGLTEGALKNAGEIGGGALDGLDSAFEHLDYDSLNHSGTIAETSDGGTLDGWSGIANDDLSELSDRLLLEFDTLNQTESMTRDNLQEILDRGLRDIEERTRQNIEAERQRMWGKLPEAADAESLQQQMQQQLSQFEAEDAARRLREKSKRNPARGDGSCYNVACYNPCVNQMIRSNVSGIRAGEACYSKCCAGSSGTRQTGSNVYGSSNQYDPNPGFQQSQEQFRSLVQQIGRDMARWNSMPGPSTYAPSGGNWSGAGQGNIDATCVPGGPCGN